MIKKISHSFRPTTKSTSSWAFLFIFLIFVGSLRGGVCWIARFRCSTSGWLCVGNVIRQFRRQRAPQTGLLDDGWGFRAVIARVAEIRAGRAYYLLISSVRSGENKTWTSWSEAFGKHQGLLLIHGEPFLSAAERVFKVLHSCFHIKCI